MENQHLISKQEAIQSAGKILLLLCLNDGGFLHQPFSTFLFEGRGVFAV